MFRGILLCTVLLFSSVALAQMANDEAYRKEIMVYVIDPCYRYSLEMIGGIPGLTGNQALDLLKIMQKDETEQMIRVVLPLVKGQTKDARDSIYKFSKEQCIAGTHEADIR